MSHPGHEPFMRQALAVAKRGWGDTHPNPLVGALIVYDLLSRKSLHPATVVGAAVSGGLKLGGVLLLAPSPLGPWLVRAMVAVAA